MKEERWYSVEEISRLTGLEPETIKGYIRRGKIKAKRPGSAFDENYRVKETSLLENEEIRELILCRKSVKKGELSGKGELEAASLMELVDRYRALLEEIAHFKIKGAALMSSSDKRRELEGEPDDKARETRELEREINELRGKILAKEAEIRRLNRKD